ncbi:MAG: GHKL domain-containing protein [Candidatus Galacturonibacter soehngenii]|nr:GHKL domain-containing protein [Candidatus Galacturonibacter soehngenii]
MDFIMYSLKGSLSVICEMMIYWILFNGVFMRKKKRWINVIALFIYGFSILVISYVGRAGLPSTVKLIMVVFIGAMIARILFDASWKNIFVYKGIFALCAAISDSLAMGILSISHGPVNVQEILSNYVIAMQGIMLSKAINIMMVSIFVKRFGKETNRYSMSEVLILMLQGISGIACLLMVIEFSYYNISTYKVSSFYLIIVSILILASYIVFYSVFESYVRKRNVEQEAMKIQFYNQGQYDYYAALEEENVNVRKMYHDLKNHLLAIQGLSNEQSGSSEAYLQRCLEAVKGYDEFYDTGNQLADIIFYEKCNTAKVNNIKTKIMIQKNSLNDIDMLDLCAILTNSFDNAMEACRQCSGERYIQVKTIKNEAAIIITVKNNYENEPVLNEKGELISSKKNKAKHGIGMQSLRMAASKYHGNVEISIDKEKKEFLLIIMIPIAYQNTL